MVNDDGFHRKFNFWAAWMIANAIGLGTGWLVGEFIGREVFRQFGWMAGQVSGTFICEAFLWTARIGVISRFHMQKMFRLFDAFIWPSTEIVLWIGTTFASGVPHQIPDEHSLFGVTSSALLGFLIGPSLWIMLSLMRMVKPGARFRFGTMFLLSLAGFILGTFIFSALFVGGLELGEAAVQQFGYIWGVLAAGLVCGALIGGVSGIFLARWLQPANPPPTATGTKHAFGAP